MIRKLLPFGSSDDDDGGPTAAEERAERHASVPDTGRFHKDLISPAGIHEEATTAKVGDHHVKTFFINGWPDEPTIGFLNEVLMDLPVQNDISIHISPFDSELIIKKLGKQVERTQAKLQGGGGSILSSQRKYEEFQETQDIYQALKDTDTELFDVGMYVTIRGETEEELQAATDELLKAMRSAPALLKPTPMTNRQIHGMQTVSPINKDTVGYKTEMMGGALGAMIPFSSKSIVEPSGVDFGIHAGNGSPVIVDRWERQNGYNQLTVGKIGSGKSFSTKLNVLRSYASRNDTRVFLLDPVGGFDSITTALAGEKITVGGRLGLNPMEIHPTPEKILQRAADMDPYTVKKKNVMDFFEMYFHQRGVELDDSRGILEQAVELAYKNKGITRDIETHDKESPTVQDVINIIEGMAENPGEYADADSQQLRDDIEQQASRLITGFQQFKTGGQYENLAGHSDLDIRDNDVTYFDLSQQEGSGDIGLMMQLLFSEVYQIAKETDDKVMFLIDEAHYLMKDAKTLQFLETAVRHSRHLDLSINFITQTIEEFFSHEKSEAIAQQCSIRLFQRMESGLTDEIAETLDLNEPEKHFIRTAQAGDPELGYSEALLGVGDYGYVPIQVVASDLEEEIINYEPREDDAGGMENVVDESADQPSEYSEDDYTNPEDLDPDVEGVLKDIGAIDEDESEDTDGESASEETADDSTDDQ